MSKYTAFRCPEDLLEKAKAKASKDNRSLSNYLITLIVKDTGGSGKTAPLKPLPRGSSGGAKNAIPAKAKASKK